MLNALRAPLRSAGLLAIVAFAIGGALLLATYHLVSGMARAFDILAALLLLPVAFLVLGQLHCYGTFLLQVTSRGHDEPPAPPRGVLNPFASTAPPFALALVAIAVSCTELAAATSSATAGLVAGAFFVVLPASITLMGFADSGPAGLDPRAIGDLLAKAGVAYVAFAATVDLGYALLFAAILHADTLAFFALLGAGYAYLVTQALAGRILFALRNELMLETDRSPEQDVANARAAEAHELDQLLSDLHRLCAGDRYKLAYERLDAYLARDKYRNDALVHEALRQFQGRDLRLEHACFYIERLIAARRTHTAWQVCKQCLTEEPTFRPMTDRSTIALVGEAGDTDAPFADLLLEDFGRAYPGSAMLANAAFRRARLKIEHLGERDEGLSLLREIARDHPQFATIGVFRDYFDSMQRESR
jgi:hypothetical protein